MRKWIAVVLSVIFNPVLVLGGEKTVRCQVIDNSENKAQALSKERKSEPLQLKELKRDALIKLLENADIESVDINFYKAKSTGTWTEPKTKSPFGPWTEATE